MISFSIRKAIVVGFIAALCIICFFAFYTYRNMKKGEENENRLSETLGSLKAFETIYDDLQNIETGQRGYIISGDSIFLQPYEEGRVRLVYDSPAVRNLVAHNARRRDDIQQLLHLVRSKMDFVDTTIRARSILGKDGAEKLIASGRGKNIMDSVRVIVARVEAEDRAAMNRRNAQFDLTARRTTNLFFWLAGLFLFFSITFFLLIRRDVRKRLRFQLASEVDRKTIEFKDILDRISDGFIALDLNWRYVYVNDSAARLMGKTKQELIGRPMWQLEGQEKSEFYQVCHRALRTQEAIIYDAVGPITQRWYENHIYPSRNGLSIHFRDITEERETENNLRDLSERFNIVTNATNDVLWEADLKSGSLWWNDNFFDKFGYNREMVTKTGESWESYIHPEDKARVLGAVNAAIADKNIVTWKDEYRFARADGNYVNIFDRCFIVRDQQGDAVRLIGSMADVTALMRTRDELKISERRFKLIFDTTVDVLFVLNVEPGNKFRVSAINKPYLEMTGLQESDLVGRLMEELIPPEEVPARLARFRKAIESRQSLSWEETRNYQSGQRVGIISVTPVYDDNDNCILLIGSMHDITDRKKSEEALRQSEEKYRTLVEQANDAIFISEPNGRFSAVNSAGLKMSQYSLEELQQRTIYDLADPEELKVQPFRFDEMRGGGGAHSERRMIRKDGSVVDVDINAKFLSDGRFIAFVRDITERKRIEREVAKARDLADTLIDSLPGVFYFYDENGKFIRWNKRFEAVTGYSSAEIAAMHPTQFFDESEREYITGRIMGVFEKGVNDAEANFLTRNGEKIPYYFKAALISYEDKPCLLGTGIDITERVKAEQELQASFEQIRELTEYVQNIREEERAHIAREIHDELGQQLTVLKMDVSWLNKRVGNINEQVNNKLLSLTEMLDGTVRTVRRISSELRPSLLDDLGLVAAIDWLLKDFEKRSGVSTFFDEPAEDLKLSDSTKIALFRIFQESLTNVARHAQAETVHVALKKENGKIILRISDDGIGFDEQTVGEKRTLGILGMKERTAMLGGTYDVKSEPGNGTLVVVSVPQ